MLTVTFPDNCRTARRWIASVILGEFLGLMHDVEFDDGTSTRICADGKILALPDVFLTIADGCWLLPASLPREPLARWRMAHICLYTNISGWLPVIFGGGDSWPAGFHRVDKRARLGLDVFGSAFFMLSRYEEAASQCRDEHGRFPAAASLSSREQFLERPIIDEYVEILWAAMQMIWPQLERKRRVFRMRVTCDVDQPYHPSAKSLSRLVKRTIGSTLRQRSLAGAVSPIKNFFASRSGNWSNDPYYHAVDWMMEVNESIGNRMAFYFIPEVTDQRMDDTCPIHDNAVLAMLGRIDQRGHEIGIHPGYRAHESLQQMLSGKRALQEVLGRAQIRQNVAGGRQHYLRWSTQTPSIWDDAGMEYDSTLGYVDHPGFRCGTCHDYPMFDLNAMNPLKVRQRPLICMEASVIEHMNCGISDSAFTEMHRLKEQVKKVAGNFTLLWHNSYLEVEKARAIYGEIIR